MTAGWMRGVIRGQEKPAISPTVIKFGGSLLGRAWWPDELRALLADFSGATTIVVGGGAVVESLRAIDRACPRPVGVMHRLAIEAMGVTARLVADAVALPLFAEPTRDDRVVVLDAAAWLSHEGRYDDFPAGWQVTSDSIAAGVASASAATLLLVKSVPPSSSTGDLVSLARQGWVDDHFPVAAAGLARIAWAVPEDVIPTSNR